jgi:hypothetical protein
MPTMQKHFDTKIERDDAWRKMKQEGHKHLFRYTTSINTLTGKGMMIYILSYPVNTYEML